MTAPRRYRMALCAYPRRYRKDRGDELLSTLADGDDERGRASTREALALAYRGLLQRCRIATSSDGLLVIAASLVLVLMLFNLSWGDSVMHLQPGIIVGWDLGPGTWVEAALLASACTVLAAGPGRAVDDPSRRRIATSVVFFLALIAWAGPGGIFKYVLPGPGELADYLGNTVAGIVANWHATLPFAAATAAATWLALTAISRLRPAARRTALATLMAATGLLAIALTVTQAGPQPIDGNDALAGHESVNTLGAALFVTGASILLALAASGRRGSNPY
jgi:hypothetical protein